MSEKKQNKTRKIFIEDLPRWSSHGKAKEGTTNWKKCVGHKVKGIYNNIEFEVEIINYIDGKLYIRYKNYDILKIKPSDFIRCKLGELLKYENNKFIYDETNPRRIDLRNIPLSGRGFNWGNVAKNKTKVKFNYDDIEGIFKIIEYNWETSKLTIEYLGNNYEINTGNFVKSKFGIILGKITPNFKVETGQVFKDEKRNLTITDREYRKDNNEVNRKWYKYTCNKCGWTEGWVAEGHLLKGQGCSCCKGLSVVEGINDIPTTAPWMVKYFQGGYDEAKLYTYGSSQKIYPICPDCDRIKDKLMSTADLYSCKSISCICSDKIPYTEKLMFSVLEQLKLDFKTQLNKTTFKWCDDRRYDFYFNYNNEDYIIETHGLQHYEEGFETCGGDSLEEIRINDKYKKELAIKNGIKEGNYIIIDCRYSKLNYIKQNVLSSRLSEIFDLSIIDWNKVEEFALSNRVKEACNIKKENPDMTTKDIGEIMRLNRVTIIRYLKQGTELSWCNYDAREESIKARTTHNNFIVEVYKNGEHIGTFQSLKELKRRSKELYGHTLYGDYVNNVCKGTREEYHGFTFKITNSQQSA